MAATWFLRGNDTHGQRVDMEIDGAVWRGEALIGIFEIKTSAAPSRAASVARRQLRARIAFAEPGFGVLNGCAIIIDSERFRNDGAQQRAHASLAQVKEFLHGIEKSPSINTFFVDITEVERFVDLPDFKGAEFFVRLARALQNPSHSRD